MRAGLDILAQSTHGARHHGGTLRVASAGDHGLRTLSRSLREQRLRFFDGAGRGALREGVRADVSGVRAADALAGDALLAVLLFETGAGCWADCGALPSKCISGVT